MEMKCNIRLMKHQIEMINSTIGYDSEIVEELSRLIGEIERDVQKYNVYYSHLGIAARIAIEAARVGIVAIYGNSANREAVANDAFSLYKVAENALNRYCGLAK